MKEKNTKVTTVKFSINRNLFDVFIVYELEKLRYIVSKDLRPLERKGKKTWKEQ